MIIDLIKLIFVGFYLLCFAYAIGYFIVSFAVTVISKGKVNVLGNKVNPPFIGDKPQINRIDTVKQRLFNAWLICVAISIVFGVLIAALQPDLSCVDSSRFFDTGACDFLPDSPLP